MKYKYYPRPRLRDMRELFRRADELYGSRIAYREINRSKQITEYTYHRLRRETDALGTALLNRGMAGFHIALLGESSFSWVLGYLAVTCGVGVAVPLDKELPAQDIARLLQKSDADAIFCSQTFVPMITGILCDCPNLKICVVTNPSRENEGFLCLADLVREGMDLLAQGESGYVDARIDPDAMCEILFTSGTTGANKGVMLCHRNIMAVVYGMMQLIQPPPVCMSVLPINHSYECTCNVLGCMLVGSTLCFNDSLKHLMDNLCVFQPGMSLMVPLFLETMYKRIWKEAKSNNLNTHLRYGVWYSNLIRKIGIDERRLFFKPVLERFGGNLEQIVCGGAPLRTELIKGFDSFGINIVNGYGITECAPVIATNCTAWKRMDSVGQVLPVCKVRIDHPDKDGNGEVQVTGDSVMLGYYKDEESTRASFTDDGYFKTGDLGRLDRHNFLYLSGRVKNLIILSNGKNVCPEELEEEILAQMAYIKEVLVYAHAPNPFVEDAIHAAVYLDPEAVEEWGQPALKERLDADLRRLNARLPVYKRVQDVHIRDHEFEKTTTKKIKRQAALDGRIKLA